MAIYEGVELVDYHPHPEMFWWPMIDESGARSVLDVGTGFGGVMCQDAWEYFEIIERRAACDIHSIKDLGPKWEVFPGIDILNLVDVFGAESFDIVQCFEVLEHVSNIDRALEQLLQVARRGILVSSADESHHLQDQELGLIDRNPHQAYVAQPTPEQLQKWGFEVRAARGAPTQLIAWRI